MTINQLEYFLEVALCGNYTRASEKIHVTQPTLSKAIKSLEKEIGVPLFVRTREGVSLSEAGETLIRDVRHIVSGYHALDRSIHEIQHGLHTVRIGIVSGFGYCFIPEITLKLVDMNVELNWTESQVDILLASLKSGDIDIAVLPESRVDSDIYDCVSFKTVEYILLVSVKNKLNEMREIRPEMLADECLILFDDTRSALDIVNGLEGWENFTPKSVFLTNQLSTVLELVERDMGVALVIRKVHEKIHSRVLFGAISLEPHYNQNLVLAWKRKTPQLNAIKKIVKVLG